MKSGPLSACFLYAAGNWDYKDVKRYKWFDRLKFVLILHFHKTTMK